MPMSADTPQPARAPAVERVRLAFPETSLAHTLGVRLDVTTVGDLRRLPSTDHDQLLELAHEAVANAIRRGATRIDLSLGVDASAVSLACTSWASTAAPSTSPRGRGHRYAALRTEAHRGRFEFDPGPPAVLRAEWPRGGGRAWRLYPSPGVVALAMLVPLLALGAATDAWAATSFGCVAVVPASAAFHLMRLRGLELEADERALLGTALRLGRGRRWSQTREFLGPSIERLEEAAGKFDLAATRLALASMSRQLSELLQALEAEDAASASAEGPPSTGAASSSASSVRMPST